MQNTTRFGVYAFMSLVAALATGTALAAERPVAVPAEQTRTGDVRIWTRGFAVRTGFAALPKTVTGGGFIATGDVDGDGSDEIVVAAGPGAQPYVNIFETDGTKVRAFLAYASTFRGGVRVAVGDLNGDGKAEIVTSPGPGMAPAIRIFDAGGGRVLKDDVMAYATGFQGGVHIAVGDLNGDGKAEIVTSPGPGGGPHVRVWNGTMTNLNQDFFAFDEAMRDGTSIMLARTPQGMAILAAPESWSDPVIRRFSLARAGTIMKEFRAFDSGTRSGLTLAAFDMDGDGYDEIASARNGGEWPEVRLFDIFGTRVGTFLLHDATYRGGLSMASVRMGQEKGLAVIPSAAAVTGPTTSERNILVDISEQRLTSYEHGRVAKTFLVSTGTYKYPTPLGTTTVLKKIPIMDYRWSYGVNHPDNYFLRNVKWNLNVFPHIYIHTAYWHNNFGYRMSHGCINMRLKDAEWVYGFADVGTTVEVRP
ncbi:MAG: L,D-transpeptidase family protein [Patescibacteria group bacterium]